MYNVFYVTVYDSSRLKEIIKKVSSRSVSGKLISANHTQAFLIGISDDKTGSWHFQGMVPNLFIRKSTISGRKRGLSTNFWSIPV